MNAYGKFWSRALPPAHAGADIKAIDDRVSKNFGSAAAPAAQDGAAPGASGRYMDARDPACLGVAPAVVFRGRRRRRRLRGRDLRCRLAAAAPSLLLPPVLDLVGFPSRQ